MRPAKVAALAALLGASGCSFGVRSDRVAKEVTTDVERSERMALESHTRSRLAAIERSLNDYIQAEGRIPSKLGALVPKYLAEIPEVELGIAAHRETGSVKLYPAELIVDGQINGAALSDTGGWGYVHNERRVIVFVDCTHKTMRGKLWYQSR